MNISELNYFAPKLVRIGVIREDNALPPEQSYGLRLTTEYEFDLITGGKGAVRTGKQIDSATYGTLFFRQPGLEADGWGGYHCNHIRFLFNRMDTGMAPPLPLPHIIHVKNPEPLFNEFRVLYNAFLDSDPALDFLTGKCLSAILWEFYQAVPNSNEKASEERLSPALSRSVATILRQFEAEPEKHYSLEMLCQSAHVSKYFFCRAFKSVTGETVVSYINRLRIRRAQELLLETDLPVQEIQYTCGYESSAQFFQLFRRHTGYTPKQYRITFSLHER